MTIKRILALSLALIMALSLAACGGKDADTTTSAEELTTAVIEDTTAPIEESTTAIEEDTSAAEAVSDAIEATEGASEAETTEAEKKAPETKEEIIAFYQAAAAKTEKAGATSQQTMSLTSLDGGSGAVGSIISLFEPIAKKALEKNSDSFKGVTGGYEDLVPSDVKSATAKDDGKYTTVTMTFVEQTDGVSGKADEGTVGHGVSVLGGIDSAISQLDGVTVDYSQGSVKLKYTDAKLSVKIDNATGKIVSGSWGHNVNVSLENVKVKISFISATLNGTKAVVKYSVTL